MIIKENQIKVLEDQGELLQNAKQNYEKKRNLSSQIRS